MFTGIIESTSLITTVSESGTNRIFGMQSPLATAFTVDQSVSHNGVCLTVEAVSGQDYQVTAVQETLQKTTLGDWKPGQRINLEQCLRFNGRLDGHLVQGHTDCTGLCIEKVDQQGSWLFRFSYPLPFAPLLIEKGSICLDGISLTAFDLHENNFSVAIIPYTYQHTNLAQLQPGDRVNLEFDLIGKYLSRYRDLQLQ